MKPTKMTPLGIFGGSHRTVIEPGLVHLGRIFSGGDLGAAMEGGYEDDDDGHDSEDDGYCYHYYFHYFLLRFYEPIFSSIILHS